MKLSDITDDGSCYVYSTSYRFCFPFTFAPATTVAPTGPDRAIAFRTAVSILWNRKDRHLLPMLHNELYEAVRRSGIDRLYRLAMLAFAWTGGRPRVALEILAEGARQAGDYFPFSADTMSCIRSFVPTTWPSPNQLQEARAIWSGGLAKAQEAKETGQDRTVRVGDYCRFKPKGTSVTMWRRWEEGLIDLTSGDIVKIVTEPKSGVCHVNKPGNCPVMATMELVDTEWLEPVKGEFKECEYCAAIDHETSNCPYRGKVSYGWKGTGSWRIEGGKMHFD